MYCGHCGAENEDGAKFCQTCGNLLEAEGTSPHVQEEQPQEPLGTSEAGAWQEEQAETAGQTKSGGTGKKRGAVIFAIVAAIVVAVAAVAACAGMVVFDRMQDKKRYEELIKEGDASLKEGDWMNALMAYAKAEEHADKGEELEGKISQAQAKKQEEAEALEKEKEEAEKEAAQKAKEEAQKEAEEKAAQKEAEEKAAKKEAEEKAAKKEAEEKAAQKKTEETKGTADKKESTAQKDTLNSITCTTEQNGAKVKMVLEAEGDLAVKMTQTTVVPLEGMDETTLTMMQDALKEYEQIYAAYDNVKYSYKQSETELREVVEIDLQDADGIKALSEAGLLPLEGDANKISLEKSRETLEASGWTVE